MSALIKSVVFLCPTETVGACKAGERVPGLASGDLSIWQRPPHPPVPRHHACLQRRRSVYDLLCDYVNGRTVACSLPHSGRTNSTQALSRFFAAELHLASYESEGPENNMEKDSRRSLRWVYTHAHVHTLEASKPPQPQHIIKWP